MPYRLLTAPRYPQIINSPRGLTDLWCHFLNLLILPFSEKEKGSITLAHKKKLPKMQNDCQVGNDTCSLWLLEQYWLISDWAASHIFWNIYRLMRIYKVISWLYTLCQSDYGQKLHFYLNLSSADITHTHTLFPFHLVVCDMLQLWQVCRM